MSFAPHLSLVQTEKALYALKKRLPEWQRGPPCVQYTDDKLLRQHSKEPRTDYM